MTPELRLHQPSRMMSPVRGESPRKSMCVLMAQRAVSSSFRCVFGRWRCLRVTHRGALLGWIPFVPLPTQGPRVRWLRSATATFRARPAPSLPGRTGDGQTFSALSRAHLGPVGVTVFGVAQQEGPQWQATDHLCGCMSAISMRSPVTGGETRASQVLSGQRTGLARKSQEEAAG